MCFYHDLERYGERIAIIDQEDQVHGYADLAHDCNELMKFISNESKKLVFILADNNYQSIVGYLALLRSRHVPLMLNAKMDSGLLSNLVNTYHPDAIWKPSLTHPKEYTLQTCTLNRRIKIHPDLKLLVPTSGSTGSPKLVRLSAENLDSNAKSIAEYLKLNEHEKAITSLPIHYIYGMSILNSHFQVGARLLLTNKDILCDEFWTFFKKNNGTSLAGVPYSYDIFKLLKIFDMELPSLKTLTQAGGKLSNEMVQYFGREARKRNIQFFVMYGQTEASPRMAYLPPEMALEKSFSVGIPVPGGKITIRDEAGNPESSPGKQGEIVYEGPNVMMGYALGEEDLERGNETGGVLQTGDVGYLDEDGYLHITGRMSRFIKIKGHRFSLDDIEIYLKNMDIECVAGGKEDNLCIALTDHSKTEDVKKLLCSTFKFHHSALNIIKVDTVLRNASGKPVYQEIFKEAI